MKNFVNGQAPEFGHEKSPAANRRGFLVVM
jgi:hypothetical protein